MFTMDLPEVQVFDTRIVLVQAAVVEEIRKPDYLLKACKEVPSYGGAVTAFNAVDPSGMLVVKIGNDEARDIDPAKADVKLKIIEGATHGKLNLKTSRSGRVYYIYESNPGYMGKDKAIFFAEFESRLYKIVVTIVVSKVIDERSPQCSQPELMELNPKPASISLGYNFSTIAAGYQPNLAFERDAAEARRPSTLR